MRAESAVPASLPLVGRNGDAVVGIAEQREEVAEEGAALGQGRVGEGAAGGISVVGAGGDLGFQGAQRRVELGEERAPGRWCRG